MDKITQLKSINTKLDVCFDYGDDEEHKRSVLATLGGAGAVAGTAGAGLYAAGKMAPTGLGGQGLSAMGAARDLGHNVGHLADGGAKRLGSNMLQGAKVGKNVAGNAIKALLSKIRLSSRGNEIQFQNDEYHPHKVERAFLGNPLSTLIHGKKGQRIGGYGEASAHLKANMAGGAGIGVGLGAGIGAGIGALRGRGAEGAKAGALLGGIGGGYLGVAAGSLRATYGKLGSKNYKQRTYGMSSRHEKLIELHSRLNDL